MGGVVLRALGPGAEPFPSFRDLVEELHARQVRNEKAARGEPTPQVAPSLGVESDDLDGLIAALRRPTPEDRAMALSGLANLRDPSAAQPVIERLLDEAEDDYVRETAARTLGQLRDGRSAEALISILRVPYPQGRRFDNRSEDQERAIGLKHAARQGLIALGDTARPQLVAALDEPDSDFVAEVHQTLEYLDR
ncbi:MAG: HEAT repeat domain-containing protein [Actinobacteria bacterium]|nr:MAG: HEAT repeat domain-containing protein [Actinomycetota bacterium]